MFIKLKQRYKYCGTNDPISLKETAKGNEWLMGMMDDDNNEGAEDNLVFNDLIWGIVAKASRGGGQHITQDRSANVKSKTNTQVLSSNPWANIDEGADSNEIEEEDNANYKSNNDEDDDDD